MPSTSKSQQRLMGVAYAVKKGEMKLTDVDAAYRDKVEELVDGMTLKQLKDFASTSHEDLPETVGEDLTSPVTPMSVGGMGAATLPTGGETGSGDVPFDCETDRTSGKQKCKRIMMFDDFVSESVVNESSTTVEMDKNLDEIIKLAEKAASQFEASDLGKVFYGSLNPKERRVRNQAEMIYKAIQATIKNAREAKFVSGNIKDSNI